MPGSAVAPLFPDNQPRPPVALEAEISVLGACLIDSDAVTRVSDQLEPEHFHREGHRRIYRAMQRLAERGDLIDPTSLVEELGKAGDLEPAGGVAYLGELLDAVPTAASVEYHARIVVDRFRQRRLIEVAHGIARTAYKTTEDVDTLIDQAEHSILALGLAGSRVELSSLRAAMRSAFVRIEDVHASEGGLTGTPTGYADLDAATGGWQPGSLNVVAARPSMGKTALVARSILAAAVDGKRPVVVFSYEMSKEELVQRLLCVEGLIDLGRMMKGRMRDEEFHRLAEAARVIDPAPIWFDDAGVGRIQDIRSRSRRLKVEQGDLGLIVVDYLQLIEGSGRENRQQDVTEISRGLKQLARELNAPVVALSQLSRAPEQRSDHRPVLADLRESGAIEQDADLVAFLYRPEYYDRNNPELEGRAELIIGKQRNGPTPTIDLHFRKEFARFEDVARWGNR